MILANKLRMFAQSKAGLLLAISLLLFLVGCNRQPELLSISGIEMGTSYHIKVAVPDSVDEDKMTLEVRERLRKIDRLMSTYKKDSDVSRFNAADVNQWVSVAPETVTVIELSLQISRLTQGAFDMTVAPLVELWGFGASEKTEKQQLPDEDAIKQLLSVMGWDAVQIQNQPPALLKTRPVSIDLSAIAKGYAVDYIADYLKSVGVMCALVEIGGEVRALGDNRGQRNWLIGIEKPQAESRREVKEVISLKDIAVATSGDYRNYYEKEGQRYSHTISPHTGRPITHRLASVTVLAKTAAEADAYATGISVMGPEKGLQFAQKQGFAAYLIIKSDEGFVVAKTEPFEHYLN